MTHPTHDHRTRRYLFALVDGGGTVPPELGAARRLVERGHDVTVLAEDSMRDDVEATGAALPALDARRPTGPAAAPTTIPYQDWECKNPTAAVRAAARRASSSGPPPPTPPTSTRPSPTSAPTSSSARCSPSAAMVAAEAAGVPFDVLIPNVYLLPARGHAAVRRSG